MTIKLQQKKGNFDLITGRNFIKMDHHEERMNIFLISIEMVDLEKRIFVINESFWAFTRFQIEV